MSKSLVKTPLERIEGIILLIRGEKVILDSDLSALYQVTTKSLMTHHFFDLLARDGVRKTLTGTAGVSPAFAECHFVSIDRLNRDLSELDA